MLHVVTCREPAGCDQTPEAGTNTKSNITKPLESIVFGGAVKPANFKTGSERQLIETQKTPLTKFACFWPIFCLFGNFGEFWVSLAVFHKFWQFLPNLSNFGGQLWTNSAIFGNFGNFPNFSQIFKGQILSKIEAQCCVLASE